MNPNQDPRIQIYTNLDDVQKDIEQSAKDRKDEIKSQLKDDKKALKDEMKELKDEVKENFNEIKQEIKDSDDPNSREKINIAKNTRKIVENNIEADYNQSIDELERHADKRMDSIDHMLDDSKDDLSSDARVVAMVGDPVIGAAVTGDYKAPETTREDRIAEDRNIRNRQIDNDCTC